MVDKQVNELAASFKFGKNAVCVGCVCCKGAKQLTGSALRYLPYIMSFRIYLMYTVVLDYCVRACSIVWFW